MLAVTDIKPRSRGKQAGRKHRSARESVNAIGNRGASDKSAWILDSGSIRHLVHDATLLRNAKECRYDIAMADGKALELTQVGSVQLQVVAGGKDRTVTLTDVYLAPQLARNIISYGQLILKGFGLVYKGAERSPLISK